MAQSFVAASSVANTNANAATASIALPTGATNNDVLVCFVEGASATVVTPSSTPATTWTALTVRSDGTQRLSGFVCILPATGTLPTTFTLTGSANGRFSAVMGAWRGCNTAVALDQQNGQTNASSTTVTAASITPTNATNWVIAGFGNAAKAPTISSTATTIRGSQTQSNSSGANYAVAIGDIAYNSVVATGTKTATFSVAAVSSGELIDLVAPTSQTLTLTGIVSSEAFGTDKLNQNLTATGIASSGAFGTVSISTTQTVTATGIASSEAFGSASVVSGLTNKLVSHWRLEEASGTRADSFYTNNLADNNATGSVAGKVGNAASFVSANTNFLSIASNPSLHMTSTDFTIGAWVNPKAASGNVMGIYDSNNVGTEYYVYFTGGSFTFVVSPNGSSLTSVSSTSFGTISQNTWYYVLCWYDSVAQTINIQINDGVVDSLSYTSGIYTGSTLKFLIGALNSGVSIGFPLDGLVDEATIWKRLLTSAEKSFLYNGGSGVAWPWVTTSSTVIPTGIASSEAFGTDKLNRTITLTGIVSSEAFGTDKLNRNLTATGIASSEAFGTDKLNRNLTTTGITSSEAFGVLKTQITIALTGISSSSAFGSAVLSNLTSINPTGIGTAEAFGTNKLSLNITPVGIASSQVFGTTSFDVQQKLLPSGITSVETFGALRAQVAIALAGIASTEAFGTTSIKQQSNIPGITSAEAFGASTVSSKDYISPAGITSSERFGLVGILIPGALNVFGISSSAAFGLAVVKQTISPNGIVSTELFGTVGLEQPQKINLSGISSAELFGTLVTNRTISPSGIAPADTFGVAHTSRTINASGIPSSEALGISKLIRAITAIGFSQEAFGVPQIARAMTTFGIASGENTPHPRIISGINPTSFSDETFGTAQFNRNLTARGIPAGIIGPNLVAIGGVQGAVSITIVQNPKDYSIIDKDVKATCDLVYIIKGIRSVVTQDIKAEARMERLSG